MKALSLRMRVGYGLPLSWWDVLRHFWYWWTNPQYRSTVWMIKHKVEQVELEQSDPELLEATKHLRRVDRGGEW